MEIFIGWLLCKQDGLLLLSKVYISFISRRRLTADLTEAYNAKVFINKWIKSFQYNSGKGK